MTTVYDRWDRVWALPEGWTRGDVAALAPENRVDACTLSVDGRTWSEMWEARWTHADIELAERAASDQDREAIEAFAESIGMREVEEDPAA